MTRAEFIVRWRHDLAGMFLNAMLVRQQGDQALGLVVQTIFEKIDRRLGQYYDDLVKPTENPKAGGR